MATSGTKGSFKSIGWFEKSDNGSILVPNDKSTEVRYAFIDARTVLEIQTVFLNIAAAGSSQQYRGHLQIFSIRSTTMEYSKGFGDEIIRGNASKKRSCLPVVFCGT
jgi:hypothetical protein